jgi:hypothetical protein
MKKLLPMMLILTLAAAKAGAVGYESRRFTPYFNMSVSQAGYLPDTGAFFTGTNMNVQMGLLSKIVEKQELFALYNLNFTGQAFRFPDTQEFESKSQAHLFTFEYRWMINDRWRVRPGISVGKTYTQTAAAEVWGEGLYDNKSAGYQLAGDYTFDCLGKKAVVTGMLSRAVVTFPNYTDILRQFRVEGTNTEMAGGLKDQILTEYAVNFHRDRWHARVRINNIAFKREQIVEESGLYAGNKQKDSNIILSGGVEAKMWIFETTPEIRYQIHDSNQNFLLFRSVTDSTPTFSSNYYDYKETLLSVPVFMNLTKKWAVSGGLDWQHRIYNARHPRNEQNEFVGGKQRSDMVTLSGGLRKRMNDVSSLLITYAVTKSSSNNKFERYLPYNYTGQGVSIGYQLTY